MRREKVRKLVAMTKAKLEEAEKLIEYERYGEAEQKIEIAKIVLRKLAHEI